MRKMLVLGVVWMAAMLQAMVARADTSACCAGWGPNGYAQCTVGQAPCTTTSVAVSYALPDGGSCGSGAFGCLVTAWPLCCEESCTGASECVAGAPSPVPSCCDGYCGPHELCSPPPDPIVCTQVPGNPLCMSGPVEVAACCSASELVVPAAIVAGGYEWTVSPWESAGPARQGNANELASQDAASPPATVDAGFDAGASCLPTTCEAQHATCAQIPDGCGGTLDCFGQACAQGGGCNAAPASPADVTSGLLIALGLAAGRRNLRKRALSRWRCEGVRGERHPI